MRFLLPLLFACNGGPSDRDLFVSPADGQSDVGVFQPLVVLGDVGYPASAPVPQVIEVLSLEDGGFVAGTTVRRGDGLAFEPDAPWAADHSYLWSVVEPLDEVRQPGLDLPDQLLGARVFHTDNRITPLAATVLPSGELCVVTSRPVLSADVLELDLSRDGLPVTVGSVRYLEPDRLHVVELPEEDAGLGGLCLVTSPSVEAGSTVRIGFRSGSAQLLTEDRDVAEVADDLRRGRP